MKCKPPSEQFAVDDLMVVVGVPWDPVLSFPHNIDVHTSTIDLLPVDSGSSVPVPNVPGEPVPRQVYVRAKHSRDYGRTPNCPGCDALRRGKRTTAHNDGCRKRIRAEHAKTPSDKRKFEDLINVCQTTSLPRRRNV